MMQKTLSLFYLGTFALIWLGPNVLYSIGYYNIPFISRTSLTFLCFALAFLFSLNSNIKKEKMEILSFGYFIFINAMTFFVVGEMYIHEALTSIVFPPLFLILLNRIDLVVNRTKLKKIVYLFFIVECSMALVEFIRGTSFFPILPGEKELYFWGFFRSMALKGHPLSNSGIVSSIMLFIMLYCKSKLKKNMLLILGFVALLCFNSRFSLVMTICMFLIFSFYEMFVGKVNLKWKVFYIFSLLVMYFGMSYLFSMGFGDRLTENGLIGDESSMIRLEIFKIFTHFKWTDFIFCLSPNDVDITLASIFFNGIIENCWIIFMFRYGLPFLMVGFILYIILFKKFMRKMTLAEKIFVTLPWIIVISSSNSIATGGMSICTQILLVYIFKKDSSIFKRRNANDS